MAYPPLNPGSVTPYDVAVQPGATTGRNSRTLRAWQKLDRFIDPVADYGVVLDGSTNNATPWANAYADAKIDGLPLKIGPGALAYGSDIELDSNDVSIFGPGSGALTFVPQGTSRIIVRPSAFTVVQGPSFSGFTVQGGSAAGHIGIEMGDIIGTRWDDMVIRGFTGSDAVGWWWNNTTEWTERTVVGKVHLDDNTTSLLLSINGGTNSFGYTRFLDLRINANDGQTAFATEDDALLYSSTLNLTCNVDDEGTVFDIRDTSQLNGVFFAVGAEQTNGTGGIGRRVASTAFVFGYGACRFENGLVDAFEGGARRTPTWRVTSGDARRAGEDSDQDGGVVDFLGSGEDARIYPVIFDDLQDPVAAFGVYYGENIRSPFVSMLPGTYDAFIIGRLDGDAGSFAELEHVFRFGPNGEMAAVRAASPSLAYGPAVGVSPPSPSISGNAVAGAVSLGTGTSPVGVERLITVTYAAPYIDCFPEVVVYPLTYPAAQLATWLVRDASKFELWTLDAPTGSQANGTYVWAYQVIGRSA